MEEKVLRIGQLDSGEIDEELSRLLQAKLLDVFRSIPSLRLLYALRPELKALVRGLIWWWSVKKNGLTFGQQMMGLSYAAGNGAPSISSRHKWLLLLLMAGLDWLRERSEDILSRMFPDKGQEIRDYFKYIASALQLVKLANFLVFLVRGYYPSLTDRVLSLCMKPTRPQYLRSVSSTYMNREILWHGFSEFLFFVLPHVNFFALRNWMQQQLYKWRYYVPVATSQDNGRCLWCGDHLVMPQLAHCGHLYCYYCISANVCADKLFPCCVCSQSVIPYASKPLSN